MREKCSKKGRKEGRKVATSAQEGVHIGKVKASGTEFCSVAPWRSCQALLQPVQIYPQVCTAENSTVSEPTSEASVGKNEAGIPGH